MGKAYLVTALTMALLGAVGLARVSLHDTQALNLVFNLAFYPSVLAGFGVNFWASRKNSGGRK